MSELSQGELAVLSTSATEILKGLGLGDAFQFERLSGGRNNRVYAATGRHEKVVLKWYFQHADDQRDRRRSEYAFYQYAKNSGVAAVAQPLAAIEQPRLAVYSWIDGQPIRQDDVTPNYVEQAIDFIRALNAHRTGNLADLLPTASEACYSLHEHIDCISARVSQLKSITPDSPDHQEVLEFVQGTISPALATSIRQLQDWASASNVDLSAPLRMGQRCVSPSDFGFHNAMIGADGRLTFFDFEYAGWDDPAKLLCDFYCQPEIPAPRDTWQTFADLTAALAGDTVLERQRQALLFPLYQVKWCCIVLNEFVTTAGERRSFAAQQPADLALQLAKAKRLADQINSHHAPP